MSDKPVIFILNGPNLNLLGQREPQHYGHETLADIEARCRAVAEACGLALKFQQSNHEGELIEWLHEARAAAAGVVLNAGAYTHTSVALHDAVRVLDVPLIEVHLSNIFARERFRHRSFIAPAATGVISGLGSDGYVFAIEALAHMAKARAKG